MSRRSSLKTIERYLVETTLGNSILPGSAEVMSNVSGSLYVPKPTKHLSEGERVLYRKEGIDKSLEEVEPVLQQSGRYALAEEALHVRKNGQRTTRFRHDLICGLASKVGIGTDTLDDRLFEQEGFSNKEYDRMVEEVRELLAEGSHERAESTIRAWLTGETLAPSDWTIFDTLGDTIESFRRYNTPKSEGGLREDYHLYVVVRQGIMRYLSSGGTESLEDRKSNKNNEDSEQISLKQEIDLVVEEFMEDINDKYALARVTSIRKVPFVGRKGRRKQKPERSLTDAIQVGIPGDIDLRLTDYNQLVTDRELFRQTLQLFLSDFAYIAKRESHYSKDFVFFGSRMTDTPHNRGLFLHYLIKGMYSPDQMARSQLRSWKDVGIKFDREILNRLYIDMHSGEADELIGLKPRSLIKLFSTETKIMESVPGEAWELIALHLNLLLRNLKKKEKNRVKMKKVERRLRKDFGISFAERSLLPIPIGEIHFKEHFSRVTSQKIEVYDEAYKVSRNREVVLENIRKRIKRGGLPDLFTEEQVRSRFREYGVEELVDHLPETTFVADGLIST